MLFTATRTVFLYSYYLGPLNKCMHKLEYISLYFSMLSTVVLLYIFTEANMYEEITCQLIFNFIFACNFVQSIFFGFGISQQFLYSVRLPFTLFLVGVGGCAQRHRTLTWSSLNPYHRCSQSHSSDITGSLTHWAMRDFPPCLTFNNMFCCIFWTRV